MTNLEFIKKNKTNEIVKDILSTALYADPNDRNYQNELIALHWLFSEKTSYGDFSTYLCKNKEWIEDTKDFFENLPFPLDEEGNKIV